MENQKRLNSEGNKDNSVNDDSDESEDDVNRITTILPVIIEIKVKSIQHGKLKKNKKPKYNYSEPVVPLPELSAADFVDNENENENEHDLWQIFERKPSDQYNKALRDSLNDKLVNVTSQYKSVNDRNEIDNLRSLLTNSDGSDCDCHCDDKIFMIPSTQNQQFFLPDLSLPLQSKSSTPQTIERASNQYKYFQKSMKTLHSPEQSNEQSRIFSDSNVSAKLHETNKNSATNLSAKSSTLFKSLEMPNKWIKSTYDDSINHDIQTDTQRKHIKGKNIRVSSVHNDLRKEKHSFPFKNKLIVSTKDKQSERNKITTTIVPSLNYKKIADALKNANIVEKCRLAEALEKVWFQQK